LRWMWHIHARSGKKLTKDFYSGYMKGKPQVQLWQSQSISQQY